MSLDKELPGFIRRHFPSVWTLEIMLLLRNDPGRCWQAEEIVSEMRASRTLVNTNLEALQRSGFVMRNDEDAFCYSPASDLIESYCRHLAGAYRERPVAIINLIAAPDDRLQQLADAFRFKGPQT